MSDHTQHLVRAGVIVVVLVAVVLIARQLMTPDSFTQYGFYRGENVAEWASQPLKFALTEQCETCHSANYTQWSEGGHAPVSCENCHGPGLAHVEGLGGMSVERSPSLCLVCHEALLSRPKSFPQINGAEHSGGLACIQCHSPHDPVIGGTAPELHPTTPPGAAADGTPTASPSTDSGVSRVPAIPHPVEGRSDCLLCHETGVAGAIVVPESHSDLTNETCLLCHQNGAPISPAPSPVATASPAPVTPPPAQPTAVPTASPPTPSPTPSPAPSAPGAPTATPSALPATVTPVPTAVPASPTPAPTATPAPAGPPQVPHSLDGRSECLICHGTGVAGATVIPDNHVGRPTNTCLLCHRETPQ